MLAACWQRQRNALKNPKRRLTDLRYELQHGVGEERPDGEADEVGQHFGEIRLLGEGDHEEAEQRRQVDHSDRQKPITPHCQGTEEVFICYCGVAVVYNTVSLLFLSSFFLIQ